MQRIIVIGGVAAGMSAAAEAKRADTKAEVIVFERGNYISYGACGMPYFIQNIRQKPEALIVLTPEEALKQKGVDVRIKSEVLDINVKSKKISVSCEGTSCVESHPYDKLVIAAGAQPVKPDIPGIQNPGVFFLKTLSDAIRLKSFLLESKPKKVVLIAEGHIGLEMAEVFLSFGIEVTMLVRLNQLCWWLDPDMAMMVEEKAANQGIKVVKGIRVNSIEEEKPGDKPGNTKLNVMTDKGAYDADFIFISLGMKPNSELAKAAGIKIGQREAIEVNDFMETSAPGVYAAGDCATVYNIPLKENIYMPRGTTANKQGRAAGANAAGGKVRVKGVMGSVVFKFFDLEIGRIGLTEADLKRKKMQPVSTVIKAATRPSYFSGGKAIFVKLNADKKTGKFTGGQLIGGEHVAKRLDTLSAALYNEMSVNEMRQLDFSYAPPFAPVWDPVLIAINQLAKKL
jgi:NADPH-dependent 2,4-dienoyl-CoA reductase/sulfur reductase-like enzyme